MAMTVLIVDDHASFRRAARALLELEGYAVVGDAENVQDGVAAARDLRPDLLLVDVGLPDGDGFEVAERLRDDQARPPAIVFTSNRDATGFAHRIATCGGAGFVAKHELTGRALAELLP
jgi:DNA-binding NarL/FixJ family response regulator